jgi:hypothetical protein
MKCPLLTGLAVWLAFSCGQAQAQFSQPPPNKTAPICSERKNGTKECKRLPLPAEVSLSCQYYEPGGSIGVMSCTAVVWNDSNGAWSVIDPSLLKYYWASIVDGQEYYSAPMDSASGVVFCGLSRQGYVRVTAAGGTATTTFRCDGYAQPGGSDGQ